jgi:C-terminal processing protease CtpA/Prc
MLAALEDNHVELNAEGFDFEQHRPLPDYPLLRKWQKEYEEGSRKDGLLDFVRRKYGEYIETSARLIVDQMKDRPSRGANNKLLWGMLPDGVGYLGISDMDGFVSDGRANIKEHLRALDAALDRAMHDLGDARGMIVDVRFNGGGWDPAAVRIANRFADRRRAAFTKKARTADGFTPPYTVYVEPAGPRQFTRPVVLLTSSRTASAAEIFVFCMNVLPHVQQAGMPTMGIHSDQLVRHLPNGWRFQLSNEVYQTVGGEVYEKVGIPPDVSIAMFNLDDFTGEKESVVETAREILRRAVDENR